MTKVIVPILGILIATFLAFAVFYSPDLLRAEYTSKISVDKSDKIENAISNVVSDLEKRDFITVYLEVKWFPVIKKYEIYAKGIDRTKLGKYEP